MKRTSVESVVLDLMLHTLHPVTATHSAGNAPIFTGTTSYDSVTEFVPSASNESGRSSMALVPKEVNNDSRSLCHLTYLTINSLKWLRVYIRVKCSSLHSVNFTG